MTAALPRIALDVMGGEGGPALCLDAAIRICEEKALQVLLVGDRSVIDPRLRGRGLAPSDFEIVHAGSVVEMGETPVSALKLKRDSSIQVALELHRQGRVDGVVTAGHSGAALVAAVRTLGRMNPGVKPGLVVTLPTQGPDLVLLDVGANVDCAPVDLLGFAVLGRAYALATGLSAAPTVALISNGTEPSKGTATLREAAGLIATEVQGFVGFVEGHELFDARVDVAVCDGLVGNILLKTAEGSVDRALQAVRSAAMRREVELGERFEAVLADAEREVGYSGRGGAVLAGVNGLTVIAHGRSSVTALAQAIRLAGRLASGGWMDRMRASVSVPEGAPDKWVL